MKKILLIFILYSFNSLSQGALVVKRFEETPSDQWFMFSSRKSSGPLIYKGFPTRVESELLRILDYYNINHDDLKISEEIEELTYTVNKIYTLYIYISEVDKFEWTRSIYVMVK